MTRSLPREYPNNRGLEPLMLTEFPTSSNDLRKTQNCYFEFRRPSRICQLVPGLASWHFQDFNGGGERRGRGRGKGVPFSVCFLEYSAQTLTSDVARIFLFSSVGPSSFFLRLASSHRPKFLAF